MASKKVRAVVRKLKQPSTYAGLSALGLLFGLPPGTVDLWLQAVGGVAGALAVVLDEKAE